MEKYKLIYVLFRRPNRKSLRGFSETVNVGLLWGQYFYKKIIWASDTDNAVLKANKFLKKFRDRSRYSLADPILWYGDAQIAKTRGPNGTFLRPRYMDYLK